MRDIVPTRESALRAPAVVALEAEEPSFEQLFGFMSEAELRFSSLRMRILDRRFTTAGEDGEVIEIALRHPGRAKVVRTRESSGVSRDFEVWVADGTTVQTYNGRTHAATRRAVAPRVVGATDQRLPSFARVYEPQTALPTGTLADAFVHPHGLCRNVLASGALRVVGSTSVARGREALLLRCDHPRHNFVPTDRPDHRLEVAVDRMTGLILLLAEYVGDRPTRHAEVTDLELDAPLPDPVFEIHLSDDVRTLY